MVLLLLLLLAPLLLPPLAPPFEPPVDPLPPCPLEPLAPGEEDPDFPRFSPLPDRLRVGFPSVRGGGGLCWAVVLPLPPLFPFPLPVCALVPNANKPMGFELVEEGRGLARPGLFPEVAEAEVLVKAAQPVRALPEGRDEALLDGFTSAADDA